MDTRLPWRQHPSGGYIAYPEGAHHPERCARLIPQSTGPVGAYSWWVAYDRHSINGTSDSKQGASNEANRSWPKVIEVSARLAERAAWEQNAIEMIAKAERGEIDPSYFANELARYENMMWVMDRIRHKRPFTVHVKRLVDALSREFHRRRTHI